MKKFLILSLLAFASLTSVASAQPTPGLGCPHELLWTDGGLWAYSGGVCRGGLGRTCDLDPTYDLLYYDQSITPGCAISGSPAGCNCINTVPPVTEGGSGPVIVESNGTQFGYVAGQTVGIPEHYVVKGDIQINSKDSWFKIIKGTFINGDGEALPVMLCFFINPNDPPIACNGSNEPCTQAGDILAPFSVKVTTANNGDPLKVEIQKVQHGPINIFRVKY